MGVINIESESVSGNADLIMNLSSNLPLNPAMRVFDTSSGAWREFATSGAGALASAPAISTGCPISTSANYQVGLSAGHSCIRVSVQDGGLNDADGVVNGRAELMVNIAQGGIQDDPTDANTVDTSPSKGGGGSTGLWFLALLLCFESLRVARSLSGKRA